MSSTHTSPAAAEPQRGGSYIRHSETGALELAQATQPAGADALRRAPDAVGTQPVPAAPDTPAQEA